MFMHAKLSLEILYFYMEQKGMKIITTNTLMFLEEG